MRISDWSADVCSSDLPDDATVLGVHPIPLERDDFTATAGKLELQPDRQRDEVMLQPLGFQMVKMEEQLAHVRVAEDRKRAAQGKSVSVRVDLGGSRIIKKKNADNAITTDNRNK